MMTHHQKNLHSSMVIVKLEKNASYDPKTEFTFQYGYSKTFLFLTLTAPNVPFTFQYGYSKTTYEIYYQSHIL